MPKTAEQVPEGWTILSSVQPGQFVRYRFRDWRQALEFMEFNGVPLHKTHTYSAPGDDPTSLRERYWRRRGTWCYALFERRQDLVTVALDARWKHALHLGKRPGIDPVFEHRDEWKGL
jgi:hypothetical protein